MHASGQGVTLSRVNHYDVVGIGTGAAAATVAYKCRSEGWRVAIIDRRPFGGTCALRGCDPKKVLVGAAEVIDWARRMQGAGVRAEQLRIDWPELMRWKQTFTEPVPQARQRALIEAGIDVFHGLASFVDRTKIKVGDQVLQARFVVIAAGARPADLGIPGQEHVIDSERFLELPALPPRLVFIGGGYISFEFAHLAARAGAQVTILHRGQRPLAHFDPDLVDRLVAHSRSVGIEVALQTRVTGVTAGKSGFVVTAADKHFAGDLVVHGGGRVPDVDDLALDAGGVVHEGRAITLNEYLQSTSNPSVYVAGDASPGGPALTPVASHKGAVVAENLLGGNHRTPDYRGVPSVVFTLPALASVGLHEAEARKQNLAVKVNQQDTAGWYSNRRVKETAAGFKVVLDQAGQRILGAHLLGPSAAETINLFALAIRHQLPVDDLKRTMFAYPTASSDFGYML
jgi:glutathione reductase (NADPH)